MACLAAITSSNRASANFRIGFEHRAGIVKIIERPRQLESQVGNI